MKVIVTGGAGFIGSNLVDKLIDMNNEVVVIDDLSTGKMENINPVTKFYKADITKKKYVLEIFEREKPEIVFHLAAQIDVQKSIEFPEKDADINIFGTVNILEASRKNNVKKIIYSSTAAVYGIPEYLGIDENHPLKPISFYGASKLTGEYYIDIYSGLYGLDYTILRYANVYGIREDKKREGGVISIFLDKMLKEERPTIFGDGSFTRDFIYVDDVVAANIASMDKGSREVFNIGTGNSISILELFNQMRDIIGVKIEPEFAEERPGDISHSYFDIKKAEKILEWKPKFNLKDGLMNTIRIL